jgi:hypothetical protein
MGAMVEVGAKDSGDGWARGRVKHGGPMHSRRSLTLRDERLTPDGTQDAIEPRRGALAAAPLVWQRATRLRLHP